MIGDSPVFVRFQIIWTYFFLIILIAPISENTMFLKLWPIQVYSRYRPTSDLFWNLDNPYMLWKVPKAKRGGWNRHSAIFKWTPPLNHDSRSVQFQTHDMEAIKWSNGRSSAGAAFFAIRWKSKLDFVQSIIEVLNFTISKIMINFRN